MGDPVTIDLRHVARGLGIPLGQVQAVLELLDEGNTVPFITRYRKDQTGGLDEEQIRQIQTRLTKLRLLAERKQTVLRSIESQGKLTERLSKQIHAAATAKRLEDLYLPYKPKKQTLATTARSRGLEPLAAEILAADPRCADLDARAADFVSPERQILTPADALLGAGHILAEQFSERADLRQRLREILHRTGKLVSVRSCAESKALSEKAEKVEDPETPQGDSQPPATPREPQPADVTDARQSEEGLQQAARQAVEPTSEPTAREQPPEPEQATETESLGETPADAAAESDGSVEERGDLQHSAQTHVPAEPTGGTEAEVKAEVEEPAEAGSRPSGGDSARPADGKAEAPRAGESVQPARKVRPRQTKADRRLAKKEQKKKKADERRQKAFSDYFDYSEEIKKIPPHRVLAINRGERAKVLRVKIECDMEAMHRALAELCVPEEHPHAEFLRGCARDAMARLVLPSLEREIRRELTERAETHAVGVFARNLRNLLLQPPVRGRRVLALDPGYRSGCKLAALDQFGNVLAHGVIYLVGRPDRRADAKRIVAELVDRFDLSVVTIGNGTACREAEDFIGGLIAEELKEAGLAYVIVNEAGASVYSTSRLGREEFPKYDASLRGAISIGRRLQDPLSELVKIDPASIGVGLYQHDVKAKHLRASLDDVVESCVNYVGVDVNTASPALLRYVSGLNQLTARRVYEHRLENGPFRNRQQLREVPGFGEATFVQAAGFLKITGGDNPLDATWIHPESYDVASRVMTKLECSPADLARKEAVDSLGERIRKIDVPALAQQLQVGTLLLEDILSQLARPGRDPREDLPAPVFKRGVLKLEDLATGMELTGTVLNVVDFGAFVDIGMHDSGLVHVSQLADKFVRDPHDVVAVGDIVKVWVVDVDRERRRVSLTMIPPGTRRSTSRRRGKPDARRGAERSERPAADRQPRPSRRPKPKGPPRARGKGPPRPRHRHRHPRRPVTPITEEMKAGTEPMRSFSDLAQFFQDAKPGPPDATKKPEPKAAKPETDKHETDKQETDTETDKHEEPAGQDEAIAAKDEAQGTQSPMESSQEQQKVSSEDDQHALDATQANGDQADSTEP